MPSALIEVVFVNGKPMNMLIDTGSSVSLVRECVVEDSNYRKKTMSLETINSGVVTTLGSVVFDSILVNDFEIGPVEAHVVSSLPLNVDVVLGLEHILRHGLSLTVGKGEVDTKFGGDAVFGGAQKCTKKQNAKIKLEDEDVEAWFDGRSWTVRWNWRDGCAPPVNVNRPNYKVKPDSQEAFDNEVSEWVKEGILIPWSLAEHGRIKNVIPLMSVEQQKGETFKVRPVLDFRYLNEYVKSCPGAATPLCRDRLREWRKMGGNCALVDLRKAYLQVHIDPDLWCYQAVRWNGNTYLLTRLGFGLNIAPKAMTQIVESVLNLNETMSSATSSYIDDIIISENEIKAEDVIAHLKLFGLVSKPLERLGSNAGVRVLGLRVDGNLHWTRDGTLPQIEEDRLTRRQLHSRVGELVGHFPVAGWLRPACAALQRSSAQDGVGWDEFISDSTFRKFKDIMCRLTTEGDPCRGRWVVREDGVAVVWTDASNIAMGVVLEIDGNIVEDASWLRKETDTSHINVSELDAAIRGINLAINWKMRCFTVMTDSITVYRWLLSVFTRSHNVRTRALGELLIRRRLDVLRELKVQENLEVQVQLVKSEENKADSLTRVPKNWLGLQAKNETQCSMVATGNTISDEVKRIHDQHHFGIDRTLELAKEKMGNQVTRNDVKAVVSSCNQCAQICPAVVNRIPHGHLSSNKVWHFLSSDITHIGSSAYLTVIDNGTRFCVWRKLQKGTASEICEHLSQLFNEFGPPVRFLSDNASIFRSQEVEKFLREWDVQIENSCAYRSQGNGVIERNHRTIKTMLARTGNNVHKCIYWYNITKGQNGTSPYELIFHAKARIPGIRDRVTSCQFLPDHGMDFDTSRSEFSNPFFVGDQVYLKSSGRCMDPWTGPHTVTTVKSDVSVELNDDGITRHVSHIRRVPRSSLSLVEEQSDSSEDGDDNADAILQDSSIPCIPDTVTDDVQLNSSPPQNLRRGSRTRRLPSYLSDYVLVSETF